MSKQIVKKIGLLGLVGCMLLGLQGCPGNIVYFPDPALEDAVRHALGQPFGLLTKRGLLELTELDATNLDIRSLEGLEFCTSLTVLDLSNNQVQSLTELRDLTNLKWLNLQNNMLSNIEPIAGLIHLEFLDLSGPDQEIWVWGPLVANATANAGALGDDGDVVLPANTTLNTDGTILETFEDDLNELRTVVINIVILDDAGGEVQPDDIGGEV